MYSYRPTDNCKVGWVCLISENKKALTGQWDKGASHFEMHYCSCMTTDQYSVCHHNGPTYKGGSGWS